MTSRKYNGLRNELLVGLQTHYEQHHITHENWPLLFSTSLELYCRLLQQHKQLEMEISSSSVSQDPTVKRSKDENTNSKLSPFLLEASKEQVYVPLITLVLDNAVQQHKLPMDDNIQSLLAYIVKTSAVTFLRIVAEARFKQNLCVAPLLLTSGVVASVTSDAKFVDPLSLAVYTHLCKQVNLQVVSPDTFPLVVVAAVTFLKENAGALDTRRQRAVIVEVLSYVVDRLPSSSNAAQVKNNSRELKQVRKYLLTSLNATIDMVFRLYSTNAMDPSSGETSSCCCCCSCCGSTPSPCCVIL